MFVFTCWKCNVKMREAELEFTDEVNGELFTIKTNGIICDKCGYQTVAASQMEAYNIAFNETIYQH